MSTSSIRKRILWSPYDTDHFIVSLENEIVLYRMESGSGSGGNSSINNSSINNSINTILNNNKLNNSNINNINILTNKPKKFKPLHTIFDINNTIKCITWSNNKDNIIVGTSLGKAIIHNLSDHTKYEYTNKLQRNCNSLALNIQNHLSVGLDKIRNDNCVNIYDINIPDSEPISKFSNNEAVASSQWLIDLPTSLAIGTGFKWLRIYDTRVSTQQPLSVIAHVKSVNSLMIDPHQNWRIATSSDDGIIKLWDIRKLIDPIQSIDTKNKKLDQIMWSPTLRGSLAALCRGEDFLRVYDVTAIDPLFIEDDNLKSPISIDNNYIPSNLNPPVLISQTSESNNTGTVYRKRIFPFSINSFALHPRDDQRVIAVNIDDNNSGTLIEEDILHVKVPISWAQNYLAFVSSSRRNICLVEPANDCIEDYCMLKRATNGYGLDFEHNSSLSSDLNPKLINFWKRLIKIPPNQFSRGILVRLTGLASSCVSSHSKHLLNSFPIFNSPERSESLIACGWSPLNSNEFEDNINHLESIGEYERAIALAIFGLDKQRALTILTNVCSSNTNLSLLAVALAGFPDHDGLNTPNRILWQRTCELCLSSLTSPYLKMALSFLSSAPADPHSKSTSTYHSTLSADVDIADKVGFALRFLPDSELIVVLNNMMQTCQQTVSIDGLLLSGLNNHGIELLQSYVDATNDIQTVAIISAMSGSTDKNDRFNIWIQTYRSLLDNWKLWHMRAKFDAKCTIILQSYKSKLDKISMFQSTPQIFARCQYCSAPLSLPKLLESSSMTTTSRRGAPSAGLGGLRSARLGGLGMNQSNNSDSTDSFIPPSKTRSAACPSCKKPLPHCALCLLPMTCAPPSLNSRNSKISELSSKLDDNKENDLEDSKSSFSFDQWFSWCQLCRHGGHSIHIQEWFQEHTECPVTDCKCNCGKFVLPKSSMV